MKLLLHLIMTSRPYKWLLLHFLPTVRFSTKTTSTTGSEFYKSRSLLKRGHLVLSTDPAKLTNMLIPGTFSHVDLCVNTPDTSLDFEVVGMTHLGFDKRTLFDVAAEVDRYVILEVTTWSRQYIDTVIIPEAMKREGQSYDTEFADDDKATYCTELIADSDLHGLLEAPYSILPLLGTLYHSPDDLYHSPHVKVIFDSKEQA